MDKVDATMANVNEQRELANEIAEALSNPLTVGVDLDDVVSHFLHLDSVLNHPILRTS